MRQRLFSMLGSGWMLTRAGRAATALLAVAMLTLSAQTAKAGSKLYAKISTSDNTTMTLVCADATPSEAGYTFTEFTGSDSWSTAFRATITSATVDSANEMQALLCVRCSKIWKYREKTLSLQREIKKIRYAATIHTFRTPFHVLL